MNHGRTCRSVDAKLLGIEELSTIDDSLVHTLYGSSQGRHHDHLGKDKCASAPLHLHVGKTHVVERSRLSPLVGHLILQNPSLIWGELVGALVGCWSLDRYKHTK